ncbi:MAG: copper amine oxidase-like protein [Clostridiales bacterium]|jgi:hypothetical protein|nr:copper amine oxidase-like protein [Clostridiales bacterium]
MKKRVLSLFLALLMLCLTVIGNVNTVEAATTTANYYNKAQVLKQINLFYGTTKGFELDKSCSRVDGTVVFLRLIGEEAVAKTAGYSHNFKDVTTSANWASPYIAFAYTKKLAFGSSDKTFGVGEMPATQFATFILRALGYSDVAGEFSWKAPFDKMLELGILTQADVDEINNNKIFTRDLVVKICYKTLFAKLKNTDETLIAYLLRKGVFTEEQLQATGDKDLIVAAKLQPKALTILATLQENKLEPITKKEKVATVAELYAVLDKMVYNIQPIIHVEYTSNNVSNEDVFKYFEDGTIFTGYVVKGNKEDTEINYKYTISHMVTQSFKSATAAMNSSDKAKELIDIVSKIIVDNITVDMTDYEKEKAIHDYIVLTYEYDYDNYLNGTLPEDSYTVWGLLKYKTGVCQAYAEAFNMFMNIMGIECHMISGVTNGEGHVWNIVKIDGEYYQVDATWNDPVPDTKDFVRYNYFNITDERMAIDHTWDTSKYVKCNSTKYDYYRMSGVYAETKEQLQTIVQKFIYSGKTELMAYCGFSISKDENYSDITIQMLRNAGCNDALIYYDDGKIIRIILEN